MNVPHALFVPIAFTVLAGAARPAFAGGQESVSSPIANPGRALLEGGVYVDVTNTPRPQNLDPTGASYADCQQDLRLTFSLKLAGFDPGDRAHVEAWAGYVDCTVDANRPAAGGAGACWQVAAPTSPVNGSPAITESVYARDVLRYALDPAGTYDPGFHGGPLGVGACYAQRVDAATSLTLYFVPVDPGGHALGAAYAYPLEADLAAPPPPAGVAVTPGENLASVRWTPAEQDGDLAGYLVWTAPSGDGGCDTVDLHRAEWVLPGGEGASFIPPGDQAAEIDDPGASGVTLAGLQGGVSYAVVVTSLDGSGNAGPPSTPVCVTATGGAASGAVRAATDRGSALSMATSGEGCSAVPGGAGTWPVALALAVPAAVLRRRRRT